MALELDGEDCVETTEGLGPGRFTPASTGLVSSITAGKLEMVRLEDSAWTLLSERVIDSNSSDAEVDVKED